MLRPSTGFGSMGSRVCSCAEPSLSLNPRHQRPYCERCSAFLPGQVEDNGRDAAWEQQTISFALEVCQKRCGAVPVGFEADLRAKMMAGELEHKGAWRQPSTDMLAEGYAEPLDVVGHLLLWLTRERAYWSSEQFDEACMEATGLMAKAAEMAVDFARLRKLTDSFR